MQIRTPKSVLAFILVMMTSALVTIACQSPLIESQTVAKADEPTTPGGDTGALNPRHQHDEDDWDLPAGAEKTKNPTEATSESVNKGKKLYTANCSFCHGETGRGDGPVAASLPHKPADITDKQMMNEHTDGELFWKITKGKAPMPGFEKTLSEKDRWHVVNYIRTLAK